MLIGVMSDSHDDMLNIQKAVDVFNERAVNLVLHAGDFTSGHTFDALNRLDAQFIGIFGNNDTGVYLLNKISAGRIHKQPFEYTVDNKKTVIIHEHTRIDSLIDTMQYDILIYGHTHEAHVGRIGKTLLINPGATCGQHATVAVLDTLSESVEIINIGLNNKTV